MNAVKLLLLETNVTRHKTTYTYTLKRNPSLFLVLSDHKYFLF